jgi:uncharacterized protein (TIGR02271 family)
MAMQQHGTVVGVFHNEEDARKAIGALKDAGFSEGQIGVAGSNRGDTKLAAQDSGEGNYAGEGAIAGAATGAGIGALWGLGILAGALPAIGPAIAGGTLAVLLSSAAAGAAAAGLAGALVGMGFSKEEAEYYESEMKAGRIIVTVNAGARRSEALAILNRFGGYDMSTRGTVSQPQASVLRDTASSATHTGAAAGTVQAREEKLHIKKTPVQTGEVVIRKEAHTEHKTVDVPVTREEVVVERRPASGQPVSANELRGGQEIHIPVKEEQVSVQKQTVAGEEVSVGKRSVQDTEHIDETLRKEKIKVEKHGNVDVRDRK